MAVHEGGRLPRGLGRWLGVVAGVVVSPVRWTG